MKRDLLPDNLEDEPWSVRTLYPNPEYFQEWSEVQDQKEDEVIETLKGDMPDIFGITHTDADGYGCEVMLREAFPNKDVRVVTASESGPNSLEYVGEYVEDYLDNSVPVFIMDLAPNSGNGRKFIDPFRQFNSVRVIDHHEWDDKDAEQIEWVAETYHNTDKCATQIVHDEFINSPRSEITELADLTADHDLWIKEQREASDALSDLAHHAEREEFVELARESGHNVVNYGRGQELVEEAQEIRKEKTEMALNRANHHTINGYEVAVTYGQCNASDVGEKLYTEVADLACVIYPNGGVSFRSHDDTPVARDMAVEMGGGGHPCAAGSKSDLIGKDVNYTTFWATQGRAVRDEVLEVAKRVL